jgi:predicted  nucleic acid-binding Zn-ribbon protein
MNDQVQVRLDALRKEMEAGQQRMQDLERQLAQVRDTMLRISGAIQVLEELQAQSPTASSKK